MKARVSPSRDEPIPPPIPPSRGGTRFFIGMCLMGALAILSSTMSKNPVLPLFAKFLGADGVQLGMIAAASTIPGILVSLPAGSLSDLYGRRRIMLTSLPHF